MHKIRFPLWLFPRPRWGSLQRSPDPLAVFKGLLLSGGREKREGKGRRKGMGVRRRKGRGGSRSPKYFGLEPSLLSRCEYKWPSRRNAVYNRSRTRTSSRAAENSNDISYTSSVLVKPWFRPSARPILPSSTERTYNYWTGKKKWPSLFIVYMLTNSTYM